LKRSILRFVMLRDDFAVLRQSDIELDLEERAVLELVFASPRTVPEVEVALRAALPDAGFAVRTAFEGAQDRFHFVEFPTISPRGQESQLFAFARSLRPELDAVEAHPVLPDALYGAAALGAADRESFIALCETDRRDDLPFGWVHQVIKTPGAWAQTRGAGSTVAVIDTGHSTHRELQGAIRAAGQRNFVEGGTDASDRFVGGWLKHPGHGTLVCSVLASRGGVTASGGTSSPGAVTGSAPEATLLPIRAIKSVINFSQSTIPAAIAHAVAQGADVITMAMGGATRVASTERALRDAVAEGLVITCAAGNCWPWVVFPAAYAPDGLCTAVAALTPDLTPWPKSGRGAAVTIAAPGENVWGAAKNKATDLDTGIRPAQGTTLATSLTAGVAALWVARHGGRAALKARADAAGTTVQAMFVYCLTHGLTKPTVWNGARDLGAGVVDAERTLNTPLPVAATGHEAVAEGRLPAQGINSTLNVLAGVLADHDPAAAAELGPDYADYAAEILWLAQRNAARVRAVSTGRQEAAVVARPDDKSADLQSALATAPALARVVGP
jgi:hypothetical protein